MTSFNSQVGSLRERSDLSSLNFPDGYPVVPLVSRSWGGSKFKLLILVESIDSRDIYSGKLLSGEDEDQPRSRDARSEHNPMKSIFMTVFDKAVAMLKQYDITFDEDSFPSLAVANFNAKKIKSLDPQVQRTHFSGFATRALSIIEKLKPTHILICGDTAAHVLLSRFEAPEGELSADEVSKNSLFKRGWVFKRAWRGREFLVTPTLDLESLYSVGKVEGDDEDEGDKYAAGDLLYFVARNFMNLLAGRNLHDLSHIKPNPVYVDTIAKFDTLMEKLWSADTFALDTETKNLSNSKNAFYMMQVAISTKKGYCIPVSHPKGPFTPEEQAYILGKFRKLLASKKKKTIITLNGVFDTRVSRTILDLAFIPHHNIHEITAGEQLLDENLGLFARMKFYFLGDYVKSSYQNLRNLFCYYGNDLYYRLPFSKEERNLTGSFPPDDENLLKYCSLDVQSIFGMAEQQFERAERIIVRQNYKSKPVTYSKYFRTHLLNQMSNTVIGISHMEQNGSPIDTDYLLHLMGKNSPLHKVINETTQELLALPNVKKTNLQLLNNVGKSKTSLFGGTPNIFNLGTKEHVLKLFLEVMALKSVATTPTGAPSIGKAFVAAYEKQHKEVELFAVIGKAKKLLSTYVKSWYDIIQEDLDSVVDKCLRPSFGFFTIVTGRLNSFKPSLQQVPSRGKLAYYIKRAFRAPQGFLNIKYDYSAHEVRGWSYLSGDKAIAASFQAGLDLRRELIKVSFPKEFKFSLKLDAKSKERKGLDAEKDKAKIAEIDAWLKKHENHVLVRLFKKLAKDGDFHLQNVYRVFKKWVDKSHPLRDAVKAIVFGLIYGKGIRSLAKQLGIEEEEAASIADGLFAEFPVGAKWLEAAILQVKKYGYVMSPIGRCRRLWRVFTGRRAVISAAGRRAQNAPIQGLASEMGSSAAVLVLRRSYLFIKKWKTWFTWKHFPLYNRAVHDANYFTVPYEMVIPFIHIMQYMATNGLVDWYDEYFGFRCTIEPEIELEFSASEDKSYKWSWQIPEVPYLIHKCLQDQIALGTLDPRDLDRVFKTIMKPWKDKEMREYLQSTYPLLNVPDLLPQIEATVAEMKFNDKGLIV
jgi:DNA polymerase I-like protein with 3'-5' exonuclease and polymerase domains